jgi:hypothetical protein
MLRVRLSVVVVAAWIAVSLLPGDLEGQRRRGRSQPGQNTQPWPPISIGLHAGYDDTSKGTILGAQLRAPLLRSARIEFMPSGSVTFANGLKEYQLNLDAVWVLGGRAGGLYLAGGFALRNTIFSPGVGRESKSGGGVALGVRSSPTAGLGTQVELRQIFVDPTFRPRILTLGLNIPLWGRREGPGGPRGSR